MQFEDKVGLDMNGDIIRRSARPLSGLVAVVAALALVGCGSTEPGHGRSADPVAAKSTTSSTVSEVIDCSFNKPAVRPQSLILACADLGAQVEEIRWQSWGQDKAEGDGTEHDNVCEPNCAAGNYITRQVHLTLSKVVQPGNVFTSVTTVDAEGKTQTWPMTPR